MLSQGETIAGEGYAPAHITGFFTICMAEEPIRSGSTGAGICIAGGVRTRLLAREGYMPGFELRCNGSPISSPTCSYVASKMVPQSERYAVTADQESVLPANYGYGISGSSALSLAISINRAFKMGMRLREVASVAHAAEVVNATGLGDVLAEVMGGLEVRISPGGWHRGGKADPLEQGLCGRLHAGIRIPDKIHDHRAPPCEPNKPAG